MISIATPNGEGFDIKIMQDKAVNVTPPEHINYFNPHSIKLLLEKAGFKRLQVTTPGILDVDIVKREVEQNKFDLKDRNEYLHYLVLETEPEIGQSFQKFLQENLLSSHMLVFAVRA
jgi:hypothetical protein